ncbi:MobQ family relaxase [Tardiphaga sp. OK245]|uniref:MobQ family relaxase n=1 Tax=Tardiphaga sp. OK245 TaxID=1855306 RepID=UPI0008A7D4E3|nr:MobQ family relaxase [Tardiphaga sp. OK245]SEH40636.1 MobA/MobL family protein [Tardiphaga sp. OK245]
MASYHLSAQPVKRSEGRSVVAMAAYRAGARLKDERRGHEVDYRRRRGVVHAEILAPADAAEWLLDRESLWNYVERMEVRKDAQLAREINMALPHELTDGERLALVRAFVRKQFVSLGMVADFAIHAPVVEKGDDPRNHHVHVLLTLRQAGRDGLRRVKTRAWNSDAMLIAWRQAWAECQNQALGRSGHAARVDHRSLSVRHAEAVHQGNRKEAIALLREPEIHVGPKAKKVALVRSPKSVVREVGPKRKRAPGGVAERRALRYAEFDRGSRAEWTMQRLSRNARSYAKVAARAERQMAQLRQRQIHYANITREVERAPARADHAARRAHALKRLAEVAYWLNELDLLFFALLGFRESQLVRRTVWSNRVSAWRLRGLTRGRERVWMPD